MQAVLGRGVSSFVTGNIDSHLKALSGIGWKIIGDDIGTQGDGIMASPHFLGTVVCLAVGN